MKCQCCCWLSRVREKRRQPNGFIRCRRTGKNLSGLFHARDVTESMLNGGADAIGGVFESGTVYFEELADLSPACQEALLSVLRVSEGNGNGHGGTGPADLRERARPGSRSASGTFSRGRLLPAERSMPAVTASAAAPGRHSIAGEFLFGEVCAGLPASSATTERGNAALVSGICVAGKYPRTGRRRQGDRGAGR